jgi:chromosomal replication initiation ATPase DnaA
MPVKRQLAFDLGHRPAFDRDDFLVAPCNAEAVAQIDLWPEWTDHAIAIFGPPGCGKSHLAHVYALRTGATVLTPGEVIGTEIANLVERHKSLVIEDGESISDSRALLHLFNAMKEQGGHMLLTSGEPPSRWPVTLPDLKSRLAAVHAVRINAPDDAMIEAVLVKLFADRQLLVSPETLSYIVRHMDRSFAAARRTVELADTESLAGKRPITVPLIKGVLDASAGE